jgi:hypothetical protein
VREIRNVVFVGRDAVSAPAKTGNPKYFHPPSDRVKWEGRK